MKNATLEDMCFFSLSTCTTHLNGVEGVKKARGVVLRNLFHNMIYF